MLRHAGRRHFTSSLQLAKKGPIIPAGRKLKSAYNAFNQPPIPLHGNLLAKEANERERQRQAEIATNRIPEGRKYGINHRRRTFSDTLYLPSTKFELKKPGQNDELLYRTVTTSDLYKWQASVVVPLLLPSKFC